jgi:DNA-binding NtrC family response regulator
MTPRSVTVTSHDRTQSDQPVPVRVLVIDGPDRGKSAELRETTLTMGTASMCDLLLTDRTASRQHASVANLGRRLRVKDLGSKNGTRYLGAKISLIEIPLGAVIDVGANRIAFLAAQEHSGLSERHELEGLIGQSIRMRRLFAQLECVAATETPILLQGETGTGKEGAARALHKLSARSGGPFQVFDCSHSHPDLLQAELFGHVRGAFTGAIKDTLGALRQADGGTLFLDHVDRLPRDAQPVFLRALDTSEYRPMGGSTAQRTNIRVIAATQNNLDAQVQQGQFNAGLYFRLAAVTLELPPLRERPDDIPLLAGHFARQVTERDFAFTPESLAFLTTYLWPGNVRELKNTVEKLVALGPAAILPAELQSGPPHHDYREARGRALKLFEKTYLRSLLAKNKGSATAAAREAGITRSYLYHLMEAHQLRSDGDPD